MYLFVDGVVPLEILPTQLLAWTQGFYFKIKIVWLKNSLMYMLVLMGYLQPHIGEY